MNYSTTSHVRLLLVVLILVGETIASVTFRKTWIFRVNVWIDVCVFAAVVAEEPTSTSNHFLIARGIVLVSFEIP